MARLPGGVGESVISGALSSSCAWRRVSVLICWSMRRMSRSSATSRAVAGCTGSSSAAVEVGGASSLTPHSCARDGKTACGSSVIIGAASDRVECMEERGGVMGWREEAASAASPMPDAREEGVEAGICSESPEGGVGVGATSSACADGFVHSPSVSVRGGTVGGDSDCDSSSSESGMTMASSGAVRCVATRGVKDGGTVPIVCEVAVFACGCAEGATGVMASVRVAAPRCGGSDCDAAREASLCERDSSCESEEALDCD